MPSQGPFIFPHHYCAAQIADGDVTISSPQPVVQSLADHFLMKLSTSLLFHLNNSLAYPSSENMKDMISMPESSAKSLTMMHLATRPLKFYLH